MKLNRRFLRSAPGQLSLLGGVYLGAAVLAIAALAVRSLFFEPLVREKYAPIPEKLQEKVRERGAGKIETRALTDAIEKLAQEEADSPPGQRARPVSAADRAAELAGLIYGNWIDDTGLDPDNRLARSLTATYAGAIRERVRRTLVLGDPPQRRRAVQLLSLLDAEPAVLELCRFALYRARRRGETTLAEEAQAVLDRLEKTVQTR